MKTQYKNCSVICRKADQALVGLSRRLPNSEGAQDWGRSWLTQQHPPTISNRRHRVPRGLVYSGLWSGSPTSALVANWVIRRTNWLLLRYPRPRQRATPQALLGRWWLAQPWRGSGVCDSSRTSLTLPSWAKDDSVKYSKNLSVEFSATGSDWMRAKPANMTALDVNQSSVRMVADGKDYVLNVLQPFVFADQQQFVWIVDLQGNLWQILSDNVQLDTLENVTSTPASWLATESSTFFSFWPKRSSTMILHLGLFAVLSAIFSSSWRSCSQRRRSPDRRRRFVCCNRHWAAVTIWLVMPYFTWWSIGGNAMLFFLALVVAITTSFWRTQGMAVGELECQWR